MAKPHGSVRIGPISLFTLIIVLCLAVLTVLSVTTSLAELSTTERQAATTTETYQLESVGQQFVADVDAALAEGTLEDVLQRYSDSTVRDGELISATFSMESGRTLAIVLRIQNNTYTIEQWKVTAEWIDDGTGENQLSDHRLPGQQKQHLHRRYGGYHGLLIPHGRQQRFDPRRARP